MAAHPMTAIYGAEEHFHWRGAATSRVEAFSDAVFGFAITLLIVSGEVPKSFDQLLVVMHGFPAFAICFALLVWVWFCHYQFFRRYGLETGQTIFLNACLLFFVLVYVYPLKYLFTVATTASANNLTVSEARILYAVYGLGYAAVFLSLSLLYWHAWSLRGRLGLNALERMKTIQDIINHSVMALIGIASALIAVVLPEALVGYTGFFYCVVPIWYTISGAVGGRRLRLLAAQGA